MEENKKPSVDEILEEYDNKEKVKGNRITAEEIIGEINNHMDKLKENQNEIEENLENVESTNTIDDDIEDIMKEYKDILESKSEKYLENEQKIKAKTLHIERLEEERNEVHRYAEAEVYKEYTNQIEESQKELEEIKAEMVQDEETEKQEALKIFDVRNKTIRNLNAKMQEIDKEIKRVKMEIQQNSYKIDMFEPEKVEKGGEKFRDMVDFSYQLGDELKALESSKNKCEEYISAIKEDYDKKPEIKSNKEEIKENKEIIEEPKEETEVVQQEPEEPTEKGIEETKSEIESVEENKEQEKEQTLDDKINSEEDLEIQEALRETIEKAKNEVNKNKTKTENKSKSESKPEETHITRQQVMEKAKEGQNTIATISINAERTSDYPSGTLKYTTKASKNIKTIGLEYKTNEERENKIKESLKFAYPEIDIESEDGKKLYERYEYADPNIIEALKVNKKQLENYIDVFNKEKSKKDIEKDIWPDIHYDIRKLSRNKELSYEEMEEMENTAFANRKVATSIKKTIWQTVKFAFKALAEKIKAPKIKALPIATGPVKEDYEVDTEETKAEKQKDFKQKLAVKTEKEKVSEEKSENDELIDIVNGKTEESNTIILVDHKKEKQNDMMPGIPKTENEFKENENER